MIEVFPAISLSPYEVLLFKAVSLLAFSRELRVGELVANSRLDTSGCCLGIHDVCWVEERLI